MVGMGGSRVVEFVAAWDALSPRLSEHRAMEGGNKEMLLSALTLAIPRLQQIPTAPGGRPVHERCAYTTKFASLVPARGSPLVSFLPASPLSEDTKIPTLTPSFAHLPHKQSLR